MGPEYSELTGLVKREGLHTVCQEAGCPNIFECWEDREATFLIGGERVHPALRLLPDPHRQAGAARPRRAAPGRRRACRRWACATRPSPASPATTWPTRAPGSTPRRSAPIHALNPGTGVEILVPDFSGRPELLRQVFDAAPRGVRAQRRDRAADLQADPAGVPLRALARRRRQGRAAGLVTKSNLILGLGETREEVSRRCATCTRAGCDLLTITQYLRPSPAAPPGGALGPARGVRRAARRGEALGFAGVMSGPLVRSSYRAGRLWAQAMAPPRASRSPAALAHLAEPGTARQEAAACSPADRALRRPG